MPTRFKLSVIWFVPPSGLLYFFRNSKLTVNQVTVIVHKKFQGKEIRFIGMKERRQSALLRIAKRAKEKLYILPNKHSVFQKVPMQFIAISVQQLYYILLFTSLFVCCSIHPKKYTNVPREKASP